MMGSCCGCLDIVICEFDVLGYRMGFGIKRCGLEQFEDWLWIVVYMQNFFSSCSYFYYIIYFVCDRSDLIVGQYRLFDEIFV